jgi:hypothetical protein
LEAAATRRGKKRLERNRQEDAGKEPGTKAEKEAR